MRVNIQALLSGLVGPTVAPRLALFACAVVVCCASARPLIAQSSKLHAAFEDEDPSTAAANDPSPGTVRLAAAQPKPATTSPKLTTPPAARKSPPVKKAKPAIASESQSPAITEELPPAPLKAVVPLAGAVQDAGLKLVSDPKDKGLIELIVR